MSRAKELLGKLGEGTSDLQDHALGELGDIIKSLKKKKFKNDRDMVSWLEKECKDLIVGTKDGLA